jgi:signal transduction histidine kinase
LRTTQIGSGAIKAEIDNVNLGVLFDDVKVLFDSPAPGGLSIKWDYPSNLPVVKTDSEKVTHVLQTLIENAIKFTHNGQVVISARYLARAKIAKFRVVDTGVGIAKESLPYIFNMFRQVDSSDTRPHGGIGLGLYIAKKYTEMIGGTIRVRSKPGKGSIFTVIVPAEIKTKAENLTGHC